MTAGRRLRISPPTAGSKFTHHTSPRFITDISDSGFCPFQRLSFTDFVLGHLLIACITTSDKGSCATISFAREPEGQTHPLENLLKQERLREDRGGRGMMPRAARESSKAERGCQKPNEGIL
jgi:hypothetical protein